MSIVVANSILPGREVLRELVSGTRKKIKIYDCLLRLIHARVIPVNSGS